MGPMVLLHILILLVFAKKSYKTKKIEHVSSVALFSRANGIEHINVLFVFRNLTKHGISEGQYQKINGINHHPIGKCVFKKFENSELILCFGGMVVKREYLKYDEENTISIRIHLDKTGYNVVDLDFNVWVGTGKIGYNPSLESVIKHEYDQKTRRFTVYVLRGDKLECQVLYWFPVEEINGLSICQKYEKVCDSKEYKMAGSFTKYNLKSRILLIVLLVDGSIYKIEYLDAPSTHFMPLVGFFGFFLIIFVLFYLNRG